MTNCCLDSEIDVLDDMKVFHLPTRDLKKVENYVHLYEDVSQIKCLLTSWHLGCGLRNGGCIALLLT